MQDRTVHVSHADLTASLKEWDAEAKAEAFPLRRDEQRFADTANYLLDKVEQKQRRRHAD